MVKVIHLLYCGVLLELGHGEAGRLDVADHQVDQSIEISNITASDLYLVVNNLKILVTGLHMKKKKLLNLCLFKTPFEECINLKCYWHVLLKRQNRPTQEE